MKKTSNRNFKGLTLCIAVTSLIIGFMFSAATFLLPKQSEPVLDAYKYSVGLSQSLSHLLLNDELEQASIMLQSISDANPQLQFNLIKGTAEQNNREVVFSNTHEQNLESERTFSQPLYNESTLIGEIIVSYSINLPKHSSTVSYIMFALALLCCFIAAFSIKRFFSNKFNHDINTLKNALQETLQRDEYSQTLPNNLHFCFSELIKNIDELVHTLQSTKKENKNANKALSKLKISLETEVQSRTLALEKAALNAEKANESKTNFLATMSHEIRTPMNGVIGTIDLLRQTDLNGAQYRLSTIIRDSAFSLLGVLDDILDFSKIEAGKLHIDNSAFSVTNTIEEVTRVLASIAKKRKLKLELAIAPDIPNNLIGDNVRVRQILFNLCSNAIKFTSTDEDKLGTVKINVEVAQNTTEHYTLRFTVTDNGKGMTPVQLRRIFNPFIQAESSITREYGGTGLGLSICKSLIELMLGSINVTSELGRGSEFTIELPFSTRGKIIHVNKGVLTKQNAVVITKDVERGEILNRYLSYMGARSKAYINLDQAQIFQEYEDVIWVLDGLDGMEIVNEQLRSLVYSIENHKQQVIVLSNMDDSAISHKDIFYLNAAPLCKSSFMTSILVAAGLHKPKKIIRNKTLNDYLSVEQARKENKLVLLVEDNILNQQVLTDQLHLLGYGVEVANNGEEGFKLWQQSHHPIILTDLHMPKMSGYDMVKEIRSLSEQSEHIDVQPYIVAVTANALKGEQERCLNAGMNDYVTKPLELNILESALQKWSQSAHKAYYTVHKKNTAADEKKDSLAEPIQVNILPDQEQKHPVNINTINKYINHDTAKKTRFFKMYIEQSKNLLRDINGGVIAMDENVIMGACHQLKSISNTIGAEKVAQLATEFEAYCQNGSLSSDELIRLRNRLDDHYACAEQFIYDHLGN